MHPPSVTKTPSPQRPNLDHLHLRRRESSFLGRWNPHLSCHWNPRNFYVKHIQFNYAMNMILITEMGWNTSFWSLQGEKKQILIMTLWIDKVLSDSCTPEIHHQMFFSSLLRIKCPVCSMQSKNKPRFTSCVPQASVVYITIVVCYILIFKPSHPKCFRGKYP